MRIIYGYLIILLVWGCGENKKKEKQAFTGVQIIPVYIDTVSIRAIQPIDEKRIWFAGSSGKVGLIDGNIPKIAQFSYKDSLLQFRSIAYTGNNVFVLSIANPAVLYKIGFDGINATSAEEVYFEEHEKVFYNALKFF